MLRKTISVLLILVLCLSLAGAQAERKNVVKDSFYLGAMRVVRCREFVSLREAPDKKADTLAEVPLGAIVLYCTCNERLYAKAQYRSQIHMYVRCEYEGQEGYIMRKYLEPAPEYEPAVTKAENVLMTREEIIGGGDVVLNWQEFNVAVLAAYEVVQEEGTAWERLRVGCFIDDEPVWGYVESMQQRDEGVHLKAFMGGTEDEPQVYVHDQGYGLIMLDLMDGIESWTIELGQCDLGDAGVILVNDETGILYVAGTDGPDPVAISAQGNILWRSEPDDPEVYGPRSITLNPNDIEVHYESGAVVKLEYNGDLISISDAFS